MQTFRGLQVPEGATHYSDVSEIDVFYEYEGPAGVFQYYSNELKRWVLLPPRWAADYKLKELPERFTVKSDREKFIERCETTLSFPYSLDREEEYGTLYDNGARFVENDQ